MVGGKRPGSGRKKGFKHTEEHKKMLSEKMKGRKYSIKHRQNISKGKKGKRTSSGTEFQKGHKDIVPLSSRKNGIFILDKLGWFRNYRKRRRALKKGAVGTHTLEQWELLRREYNFTCPSCLRKEPEIKLTEDHIIPLTCGGSDDIGNIQPLCRSCNSRKNNKLIEKYEYVKQ